MAVQLRSLRITADMDASGYARGAQQKVAADQAMIASAKAFGTSLATSDAALARMPVGMARLSRAWVEGYSEAEKFQRALTMIDTAIGEGMGVDRAVTMVTALQSHFGLAADAADLFHRKLVSVAQIAGQVNAQAAINSNLGVNAAVGKSAQDSSSLFEAEYNRLSAGAARLREEINPLAAAQARLNSELAEYAAMARYGALGAAELTAAQDMAQAKFLNTSEHIRRVGNNVRLSRFEVANLSYQLNDIAVMMASGQNPFMMLMQQGMQIGQIIGPHGLQGGVKALGGGILQFLTSPVNLAVLGFAALAGGGAYAFNKLREKGRDMEEVLKDQIAAVGKLKDSFGSLGQEIGKLAAPDSRVASQISSIYNQEALKELMKQQAAALFAITPAKSSDQAMFGEFVPEGDRNNQYEEFTSIIEKFSTVAKGGQPAIAGLQKEVVALMEAHRDNSSLQKVGQEILKNTVLASDYQRQIEAAKRALEYAPYMPDIRAGKNVNDLLGSIRGMRPDPRSPLDKLDQDSNAALGSAHTMSAVEAILRETAETRKYLNSETAKTVALNALELSAIQARSPAQKAHIAAERERIGLINSAIDGTERDMRVTSAYAQAFTQASYAIAEANRQRAVAANDNIKKQQIEVTLVGASAYQRSLETSNLQTYLDLQKQAADNGLSFDKAQYELLKKKNEEAAHFIELQTAQKLTYDLENQRRYLDMTPSQADIAQKMDGSGLSKTSEFYDQIRSQMQDIQSYQRTAVFGARSAFNEIMDSATNSAQITKDIIKDIYSQGESIFTNFVTTGKLSVSSLIETLTADLAKFAYSSGFRALMGMGTDGSGGFSFSNLISGLFSGSTFSATGNGFYANGAAFGSGSELFGQGGSFTNGIFSRPTAFPMAHGKVGVMGERDTEAVMPLARGSDGKLGVHVSGQQASSAPVSIDAKTNVIIYGNTDARQLKAILDAREANMKKALPGWIRDAQKRGKI